MFVLFQFARLATENIYVQSFTYCLCMQDQGLEMISEGLDTLKNMAHDMNEVWVVS